MAKEKIPKVSTKIETGFRPNKSEQLPQETVPKRIIYM